MTDHPIDSTGSGPANSPATGPGRSTSSNPRLIAALLAVIALALITLVVVLVTNDGDDGDGTSTSISSPSSVVPSDSSNSSDPSTTVSPATTLAPSTTLEATTTVVTTTSLVTTTSVVTTTAPPVDDRIAALWPWVDSDVRYTDPVDAARGFALDFIGFTDPIIGPFVQGDGRSGEVEVRSIDTFAPTVVFVRQLGTDSTWWVIGSATENIIVDQPQVGDQIGSPLAVSGRSSASEGTVYVEIRADGVDEAIFSGFVTGGGPLDAPGPFSEVFEWPNPGVGSGAIVFQTTSTDDGRIFEAGVIRVHFAAT